MVASVASLLLLSSTLAPMQAARATGIDIIDSFWVDCETGIPNDGSFGLPPSYLVNVWDQGPGNPVTIELDDGYSCDGEVFIPDEVTHISASAFEDSSLTSIQIANTVVEIGDNAFKNAKFLTSVTFQEQSTLDRIGEYAFYVADDESTLETITIPSSVTSILTGAFERTVSLTSVTFEPGSQLTEIPNYAFQSARSLTSIEIPSSVSSIGVQAFSGASSLSSVVLEEDSQLESIGDHAFRDASSLRTFYFPELVDYIGSSAFWGASRLDTFVFQGDAPSTVMNSFFMENNSELSFGSPEMAVGPLAKAFIQPSATGFQVSDPSAAGYGPSKIEIYWEGLIVRLAPPYEAEELHRDWERALPSPTNSPVVGDTVYASAFERELSRTLLQDPSDQSYETPEEYVYRITKAPNSESTSVDLQGFSDYHALTATEQDDWYAGMSVPYQFSWMAFMCVSNADRSLSTPNGISLNYATREDGVFAQSADFERDTSFMFRDFAGDLRLSRSPSNLAVVGESSQWSYGTVGGNDYYQYFTHALSALAVESSCQGGSLQALKIVDSNQSPIQSKEFQIPSTLSVEVAQGIYTEVSAVGNTIGVTGIPLGLFHAALWGLTTIAPPAPNISLSSATETVTAGTAIAGYTIFNSGSTATSFSISPAARNGLSFNTSTGVLSGVPTAAASAVTYTITATNTDGSDTATFTLTVTAASGSNSAPQQSSGYAGPQITLFTPRILDVDRAQTVRVYGDRLDQVTAISHGGITLSFKVVSDREIEIIVPGLAVGVKEIKFDAGAGGIITHINAFEVKDPYIGTPTASPIPQPSSPGVSSPLRTSTIWGFVAGSTRLDSKGVKNLSTVASRLASAKEISCVGYTMGPTALARDIQLSYNRAMTVCKRLAASIPGAKIIKVEGRQDTRTGDRVRRVEVKWRG
jgi:outer membrane protein OmpA-like peptidoglycan-associated protein